MKNVFLIFTALLPMLLLCSCGEKDYSESGSGKPAISTEAETTDTEPVTTTVITEQITTLETTAETETSVEESEEPEEEETGILSQPSDIGLYDVDGGNTNFSFTYGDEVFTAVYSEDNWKIVDSYKIDVSQDMEIICQALININPIHGSDMESYRTAEDMAYEWKQRNIAYAILPEDERRKDSAEDVDLDPKDQGKSLYDFYKEWSGQ